MSFDLTFPLKSGECSFNSARARVCMCIRARVVVCVRACVRARSLSCKYVYGEGGEGVCFYRPLHPVDVAGAKKMGNCMLA